MADAAPPNRTIVIEKALFGRLVTVRIDPPRVDHPAQRFRSGEDAEAFAAGLAERTGWRVRDDRDA